MDEISAMSQLQLKCPKGRPAEVACISDKCDHHAFCCKETNCCQKIFKTKCKLMKVQDLLKVHQNSCNRLNRIYKNTIEFFENLKKMVESEVKNFREWSEKSFAISKIFQKTDNEVIAAEDLAKILEHLGEYNEEYFQDIAAYEGLWDKNFREQFAEMRIILCDKGHKRMTSQSRTTSKNLNDQLSKNISPTTRIVWKESEKETLNDIFKYLKNVQSVNLLFHAASHQFSVSKFHELCDGVPNTIVIIKNDRQKIYGGFTPLPWGCSKFQKFVPDQSMRTFVFSLSHKKKYLLKQSQKYYAIEWNSLFGPLFGRCNMIQIWNKANKESSYWEHTPFSFKPPHGEWTNEMYEEMLGVHKYEEYRLLDWEVFEVIFN